MSLAPLTAFVCTRATPWTPSYTRALYVSHPAVEVKRDQPRRTVIYACPHCGTALREDLP